MNLEALALARAQEQIDSGSWRIDETPKRKPRLVVLPRPFGGKAPSCECGECRKCKNRIGMREARARAAQGLPANPRGRPLDPHRRCLLCSGPIAKRNGTGVCKCCHKGREWRTQKRARQWVFSHGGGI